MRCRLNRSALAQLQALRQLGVSPEQLVKWSVILSRSDTDVDELASHIERRGSLLAACRELKGRERKLKASVQPLEAKRGELEEGVAALKDSAVATIAELKQKCIKEVETAGAEMERKMKEYGESVPPIRDACPRPPPGRNPARHGPARAGGGSIGDFGFDGSG